jgi:tryptophan 2,3-dioxygenase
LLDTTVTGTKAKDLETKLHRLVIGQEEAIHEIVRTYQTYLAGLSPEGRPIGNFLFLGPTGTGKTRAVEATAEVQAILLEVYRRDLKNAEMCERLVDLDEGVQEWRYRHVKMVERTIGSRHGTGGSAGAAYLRETVGRPIFPDLWAIRSQL